MTRHRPTTPLAVTLILLAALAVAQAPRLLAQQAAAPAPAAPTRPAAAAEGQPVVEVTVEGNQRVSTNLILAQMKLRKDSVDTAAAEDEDFKRIYALHEFDNIQFTREQVPGGVRLKVVVTESPQVARVELVGARDIKEKKVRELTGVTEGGPLNRQKLLAALPLLADDLKRQGFYFAKVTLDEEALKENVARFIVSQGPKVKVASITYRGNATLSANELQKEIATSKAFWFFTPGTFSEEILDSDVAKLKAHYVAQGFFDAQVSRQFTFGPRNEKVSVEFIINEGPRYRVAAVAVNGAKARSPAYLTENLSLKPGVYYTDDRLKADSQFISDAYGRTGYVHALVQTKVEFTAEPGQVDVVFNIDEGLRIIIGDIVITGNQVTQDKVILRELGLEPNQPADSQASKRAQERLVQTHVFRSADITLIPTDHPGVENLSVHVEEAQTAQFMIGAGVSSNNGLIGNLSLTQRNFDLGRWPRSWHDPQAFRGAGQVAGITLNPGTEQQEYGVNFTDPYFLDLPVRMDASASYFTRGRETYDETRVGGQVFFSKGLARNISGGIGLRLEAIDIGNLDASAPPDVVKVRGNSLLSSVTLSLTRDTTDSYIMPTSGSRLSGAVEQAGALGGDYSFSKFTLDGRRYWTVTEDVLGRRSVLALKSRLGYAAGDPPIFERFYAGGQDSIRGFEFRGVGPFQGDEPVGGNFLLLASGEYSFPILGKNLRGVTFLDTGTVEKNVGITTYRASVGAGLRFIVDIFGAPVPFAVDFGFPIAKGKDDNTQIFSFSISFGY